MATFTRMRAQLQALVEPQTRYALDSLTVRDGSESIARGLVEVTERVHFSANTSRGAGALPAGITTRPTEAAVNSAAHAQVQAQAEAVSSRLQRWSADRALDARLSAGDCWDGPTAFGTTLQCAECKGAKQLTCRNCGGRGTTRCTSCDGAGNARCSACQGGRTSCPSCGGQRGRNVQTGTDGSFRWESCYGCGGSGTKSCSNCGGSGRRMCMVCSAGNVRCAPCGGGGRVDCGACKATGSTHFISRIDCSVTHAMSFSHGLADAQIAAEFAALDTRALVSLCTVSPREPMVQGVSVVRAYNVALPVAELFVQVAGEELRLLGLGADAVIRDFRNVVGRLLEHDVHALREARVGHPWMVLAPSVALERALEIVLDSEANQAILEAAHARRGAADRSSDQIAAASQGAVSASYVDSLDTEFSASLKRAVFGPLGIPMLGVSVGMAVLAFGGAHLIARYHGGNRSAFAAGVALHCIVLGTLGAEWWSRRRLARLFDGPSWQRMRPLIARLRIGLMLRGGAMVAGLLVWALLTRLLGAPR
jgi:hypothetical protein